MPAPPADMPPAPPGMPAPPAEMPPAPPEMPAPPADMPPAPPGMPPAPPEMEAPVADEGESQTEMSEDLPSPADALLPPPAPDPLAALAPPAADPLAALAPNPPVEVHEADMPVVDPLSPVAPSRRRFSYLLVQRFEDRLRLMMYLVIS